MRKALSFPKVLSILLVVILALSIAPPQVYAIDGDSFEVDGVLYEVISEDAKTASITGISDDYDYDAVSGRITIPPTVPYAGVNYLVAEVGEFCFLGNDKIVEVLLPDSIVSIGSYVFYECALLERIIIPPKVTRLEQSTVYNCGSLREIVLPSSLSFIDTRELFAECPNLASIVIENNSRFYSKDGVLYGSFTFNEEDSKGNIISTRELSMLIRYPVAKPDPFEIPDGVEAIGQHAFYCTSATTQLTIPASVELVNSGAFTDWYNLEIITFLGTTPPFVPRSVLNDAGKNGFTIYVPEGCIDAYTAVFKNDKPGGAITYEPIPTKKGSGGENNPGGNNGSGGNTGSGNNNNGNGGNSDANRPVNPANGTDYGSTQTISDYRSLQGILEKAIQTANAANSGEASLRLLNYKSLDHDTLKQLAAAAKASGKSCMIHADTIEGNAVQVRIMFNPANAAKAMQLFGSINSIGTRNIDALYERNFQNKVVVLELAQQGDFGMIVSIAASVDLTGMNAKSLYFYAHDKTKNVYIRIKNPQYRIDKNGYLWFNTRLGGYIIITDKPLQRKR